VAPTLLQASDVFQKKRAIPHLKPFFTVRYFVKNLNLLVDLSMFRFQIFKVSALKHLIQRSPKLDLDKNALGNLFPPIKS